MNDTGIRTGAGGGGAAGTRPGPVGRAASALRRRPRWFRLVLPFVLVGLLLAVTGIARAVQRPDPGDPDFLHPDSGAAIGARDLADRLRAEGVRVDRVTGSGAALSAVYSGGATLFVPAPGMMHPYYLRMLKLLPRVTRVVLVAPSAVTLADGRIPVDGASSRWVTGAADPGCDMPEAVRAGRAGIVGVRYGPARLGDTRCYDSALVGLWVNRAHVILAGASDPFRNDRLGEHHNAALAVALLSGSSRVVWLDLHRPEPPPEVVDNAGPWDGGPPVLGRADSGYGDFPAGRADRPDDAGDEDGQGRPDQRAEPAHPLRRAFPDWLWWALALVGLMAVVAALSAGRRLGPPVNEPLPVVARAAETVRGRGRLYRRTRDRTFALGVLRQSTADRIATWFGLPPGARAQQLVPLVAERTGRPADEVEAILYGPVPDDDAGLVASARDLDRLLHDVRDAGAARPPTHHGGT